MKQRSKKKLSVQKFGQNKIEIFRYTNLNNNNKLLIKYNEKVITVKKEITKAIHIFGI